MARLLVKNVIAYRLNRYNKLTGQFVCWIQRTLVCWSALKRVALEAGSDRSVSLILKRHSQLEIINRLFEYFRVTALLTSMVDIVVICDYSRCGRYEIGFGSVLQKVCLQTQFLTAWRFRVKNFTFQNSQYNTLMLSQVAAVRERM